MSTKPIQNATQSTLKQPEKPKQDQTTKKVSLLASTFIVRVIKDNNYTCRVCSDDFQAIKINDCFHGASSSQAGMDLSSSSTSSTETEELYFDFDD